MSYKLHCVPALKDNYIWLLEDQSKKVLIIDPSDDEPLIHYLKKHQLTPEAVLITHHHHDHTAGILGLKTQYKNLAIYAPIEVDLPVSKIHFADQTQSTKLIINDKQIDVIATPGHTLGHVSYYFKPYLFCGDVMFSGGCGRIFEGTHQQMHASLNQLKKLPDETIICAAHEYTKSNLAFANELLPDDEVIANYLEQIASKKITLPTMLSTQKQINLFLRCDEPLLQQKFNAKNELDLFTYLRNAKDCY